MPNQPVAATRIASHPIHKVTLVPFDIACLEKSWRWLSDPEIRELTMTPAFTREEQRRFFASLPARDDYFIWGVSLDKIGLIGAAGLKNHRGSLAEYWGYIGEREYWGKGIGRHMIAAVEEKARTLGFSELDLKVSTANKRATALYHKAGFVVDTSGSTPECLRMVKRGI